MRYFPLKAITAIVFLAIGGFIYQTSGGSGDYHPQDVATVQSIMAGSGFSSLRFWVAKDDPAKWGRDSRGRKIEWNNERPRRLVILELPESALSGEVDLSSLAKLRRLDLANNKELVGFKGLTGLKRLESLNLSGTGFSYIKVSELPSLRELDLSHCRLDKSDFSGNASLESIKLSGTSIGEFLLLRKGELRHLDLSDSDLLKLELDALKNLESLKLGGPLKSLEIKDSALRSVNMSALPELKELSVYNCPLDMLDLGNNLELEKVFLMLTSLRSLNINANVKLKEVLIAMSPLTALDVSSNPELKTLGLFALRIDEQASLQGLERLKKLESLALSALGLETVRIADEAPLANLDLSDTPIRALDLRAYSKLRELGLSNSRLSSIDLSENKLLERLDLANTPLTALVLNDHPYVKKLDVSGTGLKTIDLGDKPYLESLNVSKTALSRLDLSSGRKISDLNISDTLISDLDLKACLSLRNLKASGSRLALPDLSGNKVLASLSLSRTPLTALDLNANGWLKSLDVSRTPLEELDISKNLVLQSLDVYGAGIIELDLSGTDSLDYLTAGGTSLPVILTSRTRRAAGAPLKLKELKTDQQSPLAFGPDFRVKIERLRWCGFFPGFAEWDEGAPRLDLAKAYGLTDDRLVLAEVTDSLGDVAAENLWPFRPYRIRDISPRLAELCDEFKVDPAASLSFTNRFLFEQFDRNGFVTLSGGEHQPVLKLPWGTIFFKDVIKVGPAEKNRMLPDVMSR